ncbi:MAG: ABC transporter permease, partial [Chloroflexi bacterium]|nr:ABC transporter permease [Chloroflexota bacterium]
GNGSVTSNAGGPPGTESTATPAHRSGLTVHGVVRHIFLSEYFVLYLSFAYFVILAPFLPGFATVPNITGNILGNMWPLLPVVIGQTVVLIVKGIDLSQGAIIAFTSVVGTALMTSHLREVQFEKSVLWGWLLTPDGGPFANSLLATPLAIGAMLLVGGLIGAINGLSISRLRMPAFMVTLVMSTFFASAAIWLTRSYNIGALPADFITVGKGSLSAVPFAMVVALMTAALVYLLLSRMVDGRWMYATGTNETAARVSGVPTNRAVLLAFTISGVCAATSSVLYTARLEAGFPTLGSGTFMLEVIAATVIGGTSLFGGRGKVKWAFFGVFFFSMLSNSLSIMGLSPFIFDAVRGTIILIVIVLEVLRSRLQMATQKTVTL